MNTYRIICTTQEPYGQPFDQAHIVSVGIGNDPSSANEKLSLAQVLAMMDSGDQFYTKGVNSGKVAYVEAVYCPSCRRRIIKSKADAVTDNNLDNIRGCQWR